MRRRRAGLTASLLAAAVTTAALTACSGTGVEVTAVFDDVGDLQSRHAVQVADVRVGVIRGIRLTHDFRAEVRMRLDEGVRVPRESKALLRTTSLLGEKFVELRPTGDPADGPFLRDGDIIERTAEAPELEFIAQEAVSVLGAVAGSDVAALVRTGAEAFGGRQSELAGLIVDLSTISATLAERSGDITRIIDGLDTASRTLAEGDESIAGLLDNLARTTQVLADNRQRAITALDGLARLAGTQNDILDRYRNDVDRQIKQLDAVMGVVAQQTEEVGSLIDWLDRFVLRLPKVIPGEFTQVFMWAIPAEQDPRVEHP